MCCLLFQISIVVVQGKNLENIQISVTGDVSDAINAIDYDVL